MRKRLAPELLRRAAAFSVRRPRLVLGVALLAAVGALGAAALRLELRTSNLDLIDPDLPEVRRFLDVARDFGTPNVLIVALEGDDPAELRAAADRIGPRLRQVPEVRSVYDKLPIDPAALGILGIDPYLSSEDRRLVLIFVQPADASSSAATIEPFVGGVRAVLAETLADTPRVRAGLTGMPEYALDDRDIVRREISSRSVVSFVLILLIFVASFGALRRPLLVMVALLLAVAVLTGLLVVWPGHLTLLSAFFASILFGLGVDYGIHIIDRVEELIADGRPERQAIPEALEALAPGLVTGALTSASVLFAMRLSGFRGFEELGVIAGMGLLVCLAAMATVLPALLVLRPAPPGRERRLGRRRLGRWLAVLSSRPLATLLGAAALAALWLPGPGFDTDYLALQPEESEAVRLEREIVRRSDWSPAFAVFTAASREELGDLVWKLADDETVGKVRSIRDFEVFGALPDLPADVLAALRDPDGRFAVYAYPREDIWDPESSAAFLAHMRAIDPEVTGMPVLGDFMVRRSRRALDITATLGAALLALWVLVDFRRLLPAVCAVLPTVLTVTAMTGLMHLAGIAFNPLNVMALPVVLGIAVDDGVHLVHRFLAERGNVRRTLAGTGRSVVLTSATTLAAFGTLAFSSHRGLASFALALTLGVGAALVLSVVVLPQVLRALGPWLLAEPSAVPAGETT